MLDNTRKILLERQNVSIALLRAFIKFINLSKISNKKLSNSRYKNKKESIIARQQAYVIGGIICATSFLEAQINEILDAAKKCTCIDCDKKHFAIFKNCSDSDIERLAAFKDNLGDRLGSLKKYQGALLATNKKPYVKGNNPYQDVVLIFDLRNLLVHYEPEWIEFSSEDNSMKTGIQKIEQKLKYKFQPSKKIASSSPFFPDRCLCYNCIVWVAKTVITFIADFYERMNLSPDYDHSSKIKY